MLTKAFPWKVRGVFYTLIKTNKDNFDLVNYSKCNMGDA